MAQRARRQGDPAGAVRSGAETPGPSSPRRQRIPLLEWLGGGAGALAAIAIIGFLAFEGLTRSETPAELTVEVLGTRDTATGLAVDVRIANSGGLTAADVGVEGAAGEGDVTAEATFDFVPRGSEREGVLVFPPGTEPGSVRVRVRGYRDP